MIRLGIAVEGATEEEFVKRVLARPLSGYDVLTQPVSLNGAVSLSRLANEMANLFWSFDRVSSFVDYYGFRGKGELSVEALETRLFQEVAIRVQATSNLTKVIPYIQRHEFEGLLFSKVECFGSLADLDVGEEQLSSLRTIRRRFESPEDINDDVNTAPSKRLSALMPNYSKRLHGPLIGEDIGLDAIRAECPRFDNWIRRLSQPNERASSSH